MAENKLKKAGFEGSLQWVYNEEGSGAKMYQSSVYYPDSLINPKTRSGVTIDPGIDLGNCDIPLINKVLRLYCRNNVLSEKLFDKIKSAIGYKGIDAAIWFKSYGQEFKIKFIVPEALAFEVMANITAIEYWKPLVKAMPGLLKIRRISARKAVHTALLSMSYNRGWKNTILLAREFIEMANYAGLAAKIAAVRHSLKSLTDRRKREADLIYAAIEQCDDFSYSFDYLKPIPVTVIPGAYKETVIKILEFELTHADIIL